ncbi:hypothetical protein C8R47DRAFT_1209339 [Mycena vitilis]|nr:hypothetical protein C8R47DRAFT_1209339 [Mycena vitilis]
MATTMLPIVIIQFVLDTVSTVSSLQANPLNKTNKILEDTKCLLNSAETHDRRDSDEHTSLSRAIADLEETLGMVTTDVKGKKSFSRAMRRANPLTDQ